MEAVKDQTSTSYRSSFLQDNKSILVILKLVSYCAVIGVQLILKTPQLYCEQKL